MENEVWKPIWHAPNYEVSNMGRVRSLTKELTCKNRWGTTTTYVKLGRVLKVSPIRKQCNYNQVIIAGSSLKSPTGRHKKFLVHRIVAEAFIPNPNNYPHVNHINSTTTDNRAQNLEWVTVSMNTKHAFDYGNQKHGEDHGNSKLTNKQVLLIREELKKRRTDRKRTVPTYEEIGKVFGASRRTVSLIAKGLLYKRVK